MGYTTDFYGAVTVTPPLNADEISFLTDFASTRRMKRDKGPLFVKGGGFMGQEDTDDIRDFNNPPAGQPGLWCQWAPSEDGTEIAWDGGEKFYYAPEWMQYLIDNLLSTAARSFVERHAAEDDRLAKFTCDHVVNGTIGAEGEEPGDIWRLVVTDNEVTTQYATITFEN